MCSWIPCCLFLLIATVLGSWGPYENRRAPSPWTRMERADSSLNITLHIGLLPEHPGALEKRLAQVSDPTHTEYGRFLTVDQVRDLVKPASQATARVEQWLQDTGIPSARHKPCVNGDSISVTITVSEAEELLKTRYYVHRHADATTIRASSWSLPLKLRDLVESVQPTTSFFHIRPRQAPREQPKHSKYKDLNEEAVEAADGAGSGIDLHNIPPDLTASEACNSTAVTPLCLRTLYGTLYYKPKLPARNRMALVNYAGEFNNRSDIAQFLATYRPDAAVAGAAHSFQDIGIAGGVNQQSLVTAEQMRIGQGREGNQDAETMLGIAHPVPLVAYTVGDDIKPPFMPGPSSNPINTNTNEPFLTWLDWILARPDSELPTVVSTSYADIEDSVPFSYARRVCRGFAQLGARGVSVIMGAGDQGVGRDGQCFFFSSTDGSKRPRFQVKFPESCPWVTSVGATRGIDPEVVAFNEVNGFVSGGGFSDYFPRPAYQQQGSQPVVSRYLSEIGDLHEGMFNPQGRAYPDVAVQGYRYVTVWNGQTLLVDGTSTSTPAFASIVALVNDALLASGRPQLGFLNPWLYAEGYKAFRDVSVGSTSGCNTTGFPAKQGWDPASGWGTPWFPAFKDLAMRRRLVEIKPWYARWNL